MGTNKKLSNVIGAPFLQYVLDQFYIRAGHNSTENRTLQEVMFLANKTAWVRLLSSVNVIGRKLEKLDPNNAKSTIPYDVTMKEIYNSLGVGAFDDEDSLAKNWVLEAGTSVYTPIQIKNEKGDVIRTVTAPTLRYGMSTNNTDTNVNSTNGAYGLGGTTELGFVPMPGLTSVTIETLGRLGSLRKADVNFRVNNLNQLNVIEALYFRLGYSMLLEWGHTQYYTNPNPDPNKQEPSTFKTSEIFGIGDPFKKDLRKEQIIQEINKKQTETSGNYGGMYGIVTGFNWSATQDGGYDCTLKLIGHGAIMDSIKTNQSYTLPPGPIQEYQKYEDALAAAVARALQLAEQNANRTNASAPPPVVYPEATTINDLFTKVKEKTESATFTFTDFVHKYGWPIPSAASLVPIPNSLGTALDGYELDRGRDKEDFLIAFGSFSNVSAPDLKANLNRSYGGLYIRQGNGRLVHFRDFNNVTAQLDIATLNAHFVNYKTIDYATGKELVDTYTSIPEIDRQLIDRESNQNKKLYPSTGISTQVVNISSFDPNSYTARGFDQPVLKKDLSITATLGDFNLGVYSALYGIVGSYYTKITFSYIDDNFVPTARQINQAIADYLNANGGNSIPVNNVSFGERANPVNTASGLTRLGTSAFNKQIFIRANFTVPVKNVNLEPTQRTQNGSQWINQYATNPGLYTNYQVKNGVLTSLAKVETSVVFTIETNDVAAFNHWTQNGTDLTVTPTAPPPTPTPSGGGQTQNADTDQKEAPEGFASALQAMLTIVQTYSQFKALNANGAEKVDIAEITQNFYKDGALDGVLDPAAITAKSKAINGTPTAMVPGEFNLLNYALKGFNATLMRDPSVYSEIEDVDFYKLCTSFVLKYKSGGLEGQVAAVRAPTFISLGYLLAFLNNMCLIYDSNNSNSLTAKSPTGTKKHPLIYIDFNPKTNFCLTSPQQLSVDPTICMIPANCTNDEYKEIFDFTKTQFGEMDPGPWDAAGHNPVSLKIDDYFPYKADKSLKDGAYRGSLMNILINTQYLLDLVKQLSRNDPEHSTNLKPFLDQILMDVSKSIGGINSFRVTYVDNSNVIQIVDDQWVANPNGDLISTTSPAPLPVGSVIPSAEAPGQLTLTGTKSLTREFRFNTLISSRLASKIAISAQSQVGSVNSKDHSAYSHLNTFYEDRYSRAKEDPTKINQGNAKKGKNKKGKSSDILAAELFNGHIESLYFKTSAYSPKKIEAAKNYYLDKLNRIKAKNPLTSASPYVSLEVEMTIDGISGIVMTNSFTVPNDRLPYTYRGEGNTTKVAFIVTGLTHTIQNNEWLTKIKGQMIKLKKPVAIETAATQISRKQADFPKEASVANAARAVGRPYQGECPPDQDRGYSGALQVPVGQAVTTQNAGVSLQKGTSNIKLSNTGTLGALTPLTEGEIVDDTRFNRFKFPKFSGRPDRFVIHHTDSMYEDRTNGSGVTNVTDPAQESILSGAQRQMKYFYCSGLPAQYIIDRKGVIHRFIPDGMQSYHAGNFNGRALGVEIIAANDSKVLDVQVKAAIRLAHYLGFSVKEVIGHGEVPGADRGLEEGRKVYSYIRNYLQ